MKLKFQIFTVLLAVVISGPAISQGMTFLGQGPDSLWSIDSVILANNITTERRENTLSIERDGVIHCEIVEPSMLYFPVTISYQISGDFVASNRSLIDQSITLEMVFSSNGVSTPIVIPTILTSAEFGLRQENYEFLDRLSRDRTKTEKEYVPGFIAAMFATKYYDVLLTSAPNDEKYLIERRRLYFAQIAANFLFQQHVQDSKSGRFVRNPIILPDGDAYDLLLEVLTEDEEVSRRTVLGTRYRSFWLIRNLIELADTDGGEIPQDLWDAAQSLSECLLEDTGLDSIDGEILSYVRENGFYVPTIHNDLLIDPGIGSFNMWRALYQDRFGAVPATISYDDALNALFPN